ncbi:MAG: hypothetical protein AAF208_14810 [Cyanobacteria bacterium P01_A01_bin.45]
MKKRILIVSPHFPPINAPDHQRIRMSLPYFQEFGWDASVLTVDPNHVEALQDPLLLKTVPSEIPVTRTSALPLNLTRRFGLGSLGLRSLPYLQKTGDRLLAEKKFDLVYFSTTIFPSMILGLRWYRRFNIPYILDFQDPWLSDYYKQPDSPKPPGGHFKYGFSQLQAKFLEPKAVSQVSHIISVSPAYPLTLQQRYPHLSSEQFTVLPFGAPEVDFERLASLNVKQSIFDPRDGKRHWVYVGRGGKDMDMSLRSLFTAIKSQRQENPHLWDSIKLHFVGTSYAPKSLAVKTVEPIAQELGISDLVSEHPCRIPYFEALQILSDSDAILMIGSDDPSYTASKLYPCILARKPIFAIFHDRSSVVDILRQCQAGKAVTFTSDNQPSELIDKIKNQLEWLQSLAKGFQPTTNWEAFKPFTAREMTFKQCQIFDQYINKNA